MTDTPHPVGFAAAFERWCEDTGCRPGDDGFQTGLAVTLENFLRLHLEAIAEAHLKMADGVKGTSLSKDSAIPRLIVAGIPVEGGAGRLKSRISEVAAQIARERK